MILNGTTYHDRTSTRMESIRRQGTRVRFHWGDTATGGDVTGTISRPNKIPILILNRRSIGGGAILDHCIVRITATKGGCEIYRHPAYHLG